MLDKLKELSKDTVVYGISTIVGRFLGFLLVPFYTHVFLRYEFGVWTILYSYFAFLNIAYIYGMDAAYMKYAANTKSENKVKVFSTAQITVTITTLLFSGLLALFRNQFMDAIGLPLEFSWLVIIMAGILLFDTLALIPFSHLRLERKTMRFAVIKIINIMINIGLNIILILGYKMGIEAIFISNLAASVFSFAALLPDILRQLEIKIDKEMLARLFRFGIPYLPASIAATVVQVIDVPILKALTNEETVAVYRANYKMGIFMMLFVSMFQYAWQPFFLTHAEDKQAKSIFSKTLTLFLLVASSIWVVLSLFLENIVSVEIFFGRSLINEKYLGGVIIIPIILLGYLFYGMYVNFTAGIYIEEKTKYLPWITGAGAAVNVAVNMIFIPVYGIMGAALATLASYMVMSGALYFTVQKFYKVNYELKNVLVILTMIFITGGVYYYLDYSGALNLGIKFLMLAAFFAVLIISGVIKTAEIKRVAAMLTGGKNA